LSIDWLIRVPLFTAAKTVPILTRKSGLDDRNMRRFLMSGLEHVNLLLEYRLQPAPQPKG
jgi:hypothetical protein